MLASTEKQKKKKTVTWLSASGKRRGPVNVDFLTNERSAGPVNKVNLDADWTISFRPHKTRDTVVRQINENVHKTARN